MNNISEETTGDDVILVIDDDIGFQNYMSELLEFEGYRVYSALDGLEGIEKYKQVNPTDGGLDPGTR